MMTRLAEGRTLGGIAAELGLQLHQVGEDVGLAPHSSAIIGTRELQIGLRSATG